MKIKKILIYFLFISIICIGIFLVFFNKDNNSLSNNAENKVIEKENIITADKVEEYVDDNNITIGLYLPNNSYRDLITTHSCAWNQYTDIVVFEAIPSNEQVVSNEMFQSIWPKYWHDDSYKIGYYLSFKTTDGKVFEQNILGPDDGKWFWDYIQTYLYDDVHQEVGSRYSHVETNEVTENTIFTSLKLTASTYIDQIESPIILTVFTYNGSEDFDSITSMYRGNSKYSVEIIRN